MDVISLSIKIVPSRIVSFKVTMSLEQEYKTLPNSGREGQMFSDIHIPQQSLLGRFSAQCDPANPLRTCLHRAVLSVRNTALRHLDPVQMSVRLIAKWRDRLDLPRK